MAQNCYTIDRLHSPSQQQQQPQMVFSQQYQLQPLNSGYTSQITPKVFNPNSYRQVRNQSQHNKRHAGQGGPTSLLNLVNESDIGGNLSIIQHPHQGQSINETLARIAAASTVSLATSNRLNENQTTLSYLKSSLHQSKIHHNPRGGVSDTDTTSKLEKLIKEMLLKSETKTSQHAFSSNLKHTQLNCDPDFSCAETIVAPETTNLTKYLDIQIPKLDVPEANLAYHQDSDNLQTTVNKSNDAIMGDEETWLLECQQRDIQSLQDIERSKGQLERRIN